MGAIARHRIQAIHAIAGAALLGWLLLSIAACGSGSGALPQSAQKALGRYISGHYSTATGFSVPTNWHVTSAQQSGNPHRLFKHYDELWCVDITPPITALPVATPKAGAPKAGTPTPTATAQTVSHFLVGRTGNEWSVADELAVNQDVFDVLGCDNY
ncbi:MAG: hypothetical protein OJF49_002926 [Ktedonobacterales bacterium]|jgi:hypothetical protein|nr:MAG: hypothetical protein OJF49_002926 [Ktedonobacterales bacterium]